MIAQITGKVIQKNSDSLIIDVHGLCYEVFIPSTIMCRIEEHFNQDGIIRLVTYHYLAVEPAKSTPILVGFLNEVEKDFFEKFITVSGIGPKAALRALNKPISVIAQAIDEGNSNFLRSLPGIGPQRAKEIIAKLQGKVGKFALIQDKEKKEDLDSQINLEDAALNVLMQLQYRKQEAMQMIRKALERMPSIKTIEELLNEVYRQRK
jgi:Holliday junction DNA helicase RuvA